VRRWRYISIALATVSLSLSGPLDVLAAPAPADVVGWVNDERGGRIALTFDDCNSTNAWWPILTALAKHKVHATFFCIGQNVKRYPELSRATVHLGDQLCNHTWSHPDLTTLTAREQHIQIASTKSILAADGSTCQLLRPPYGNYNATTLSVAGSLGYRDAVLWSVDPRDWSDPGTAAIVSRVMAGAHPGAIVILHVLAETAQALPAILDDLARRDLIQSRVDALMANGHPTNGWWPDP